MIQRDRYIQAQTEPFRLEGRKERVPTIDLIYKWLLFIIVMLALLGTLGVAWAGRNSVVAKGDGFEVTVEDVMNFTEFTEKSGPFRTTPREYRDYMVKLTLFALEAESLGITLPESGSQFTERTIENLLSFRALYIKKLLEEAPLYDRVIRSYYAAFPENFLVKSKDDGRMHLQPRDKGLGEDVELLPLSDELKEDIRGRIRKAMAQREERQAYNRLFKKYNVLICDSKTERCE